MIAYRLGGVELETTSLQDNDPRGLFLTWEPPRPTAPYVIACDPTMGIEGWCRDLRTQDDYRTDNAAIQVIRIGSNGNPDVQVAEFAAPISPFACARVLNALGRLYAGNSDTGEALCIVEVWPGPGTTVVQELMHTHGYTTFWLWQPFDRFTTGNVRNIYPGWYSSVKSQRELWIKGHYYIKNGGVVINSPYLIEEMSDCEVDPVKQRGKAIYGAHDDRVYAFLMALWAGHNWATSIVPEAPHKKEERKHAPNWQASDISAERMYQQWEEQFDELLEG